MVSQKATVTIAALLGFVLGMTVSTSIEELGELSGIQLVGPVYFSPQMGVIGGFAAICFVGIVYGLGVYTTIDG